MAKQKRAELTRQKILEVGVRLFSSEGYHKTSSKKIAREAGLAVGSFYNHFKDKKDLFLTIYQQHVAEVHQMIATRLESDEFFSGPVKGRELVQAIVTQAMTMHTLSPDFHKEISAMRYSDPDVERMINQENARVVQMMVQLLIPRQDELRVTDLEAAAHVVVSSVEAVVHSILLGSAPLARERLLESLAEMIYRYLYP